MTLRTTLAEGAAAPPPVRPDRYLPARGNWGDGARRLTSMTLHRWTNDPNLGFPQPVYFGRFRYWKLADLEAWERWRPRRTREAA